MNGLFVRTSTWGRVNDSKMTYELVNIKDDSVIAEGVLKVSEVTDNDYKEITFPEVKERVSLYNCSRWNQQRRRNQYFYDEEGRECRSAESKWKGTGSGTCNESAGKRI